MPATAKPRARVTTIIHAPPEEIIAAFVDPARLTQFWLASSSAPLALGVSVHWEFMARGAAIDTIATRLEPGRALSWRWADGTTVDIDIEAVDRGMAVTIVQSGFDGDPDEVVERALGATEGFAFVLASLKLLLETGDAGGIVRDKARLIELRQ